MQELCFSLSSRYFGNISEQQKIFIIPALLELRPY